MSAGRGYTLVEASIAVALVGALVLMTAPLLTWFLRQSAAEDSRSEGFLLGLGVVPQLREDVRRAARAGRHLPGLHGGDQGLALDFRAEVGVRGVVYRVETGAIRRIEYLAVEKKLVPGRERVWRGGFSAHFEIWGPLVGLEAEALDRDEKLLSFRFRLRS